MRPRTFFWYHTSLGRCVSWTMRPLFDASLGRCVSWMMRLLVEASLVRCVPYWGVGRVGTLRSRTLRTRKISSTMHPPRGRNVQGTYGPGKKCTGTHNHDIKIR
jgi:hypothetical protein